MLTNTQTAKLVLALCQIATTERSDPVAVAQQALASLCANSDAVALRWLNDIGEAPVPLSLLAGSWGQED